MQPIHRFKVAERFWCWSFILCAGALLAPLVCADQIEMQNGDRYHGKVLSLTNNVMVLQSEILGTIAIPRAKVAKITLGTTSTNGVASRDPSASPAKPMAVSTNSAGNALASLRKAGVPPDDAEKVKQQFLADADPAAKAKFDEMLGDLMSGKMTVADLRVQAKSAADQLRGLKKELGPEADPALDGYLTVLESFLREVPASETVTRTNQQSLELKAQPEKEE